MKSESLQVNVRDIGSRTNSACAPCGEDIASFAAGYGLRFSLKVAVDQIHHCYIPVNLVDECPFVFIYCQAGTRITSLFDKVETLRNSSRERPSYTHRCNSHPSSCLTRFYSMGLRYLVRSTFVKGTPTPCVCTSGKQPSLSRATSSVSFGRSNNRTSGHQHGSIIVDVLFIEVRIESLPCSAMTSDLRA